MIMMTEDVLDDQDSRIRQTNLLLSTDEVKPGEDLLDTQGAKAEPGVA